MNRIRPAAVAGLFYPQRADELCRLIHRLLEENPARGPVPRALIVPHAGLIYSGPVAARGYNLLRQAWHQGRQWRRVLLLGPNHRLPLSGIAAPQADIFATPMGSMALDRPGLEALAEHFDVQVRPDVHALEHCLEVQLPFLLALAPALRLLPLIVGEETPARVAALVEWALDESDMLVIISTDLSHYHAWAQARRIDAETAALITACSPTVQPEQACGAHALNGLLLAAGHRRLKVDCLDLRNSGDTAGGRDQVVGYGCFALH